MIAIARAPCPVMRQRSSRKVSSRRFYQGTMQQPYMTKDLARPLVWTQNIHRRTEKLLHRTGLKRLKPMRGEVG
jgi:hypothetical protein